MQLDNVQALVTGAAGGIGSAVCEMLLAEHAQVVGLLDCDRERLERVHRQMAARHGAARVVALPADVGAEDQVQAAVDGLAGAAPGLNVVVNAAGVLLDGALCALTFRGFRRHP